MESVSHEYRFNVRDWLILLPKYKRSQLLDKVVAESGQSKDTIRRIIYMKATSTGYVRSETKEAFCKVFGKKISELENPTQK